MLRKITFIVLLFWSSSSMSNTFSEVFGSEGAAGIENPKTRSLSYTLQYATLAGSIGYVIRKLHDTGFLEPLGFTPSINEKLSPLAYKKSYILDKHSANIINVNQKVEEINYYNNLKKKLINKKYSSKAIELRNNKNFSNSIINTNNRNYILNRYYEE